MLDKVHKADVIIIGAGLSGLTLGIELLKKTNKSILILEKKKKLTKDKNWCFWNYPENHFTKKYSKKWDNIKVNWGKLTINKKSSEYYYLNISSKKFYDEALNLINKSPRSKVIFNQKITRIEEKDNLVKVKSNSKNYTSNLLFTSAPKRIQKNKLLQHFYGIEVEYNKNVFKKDEITLMDMVKTSSNEFHFMYILPFTEKKALVESTYFSTKTYLKSKYINDIRKYLIKKYSNLSFTEGFSEYGVLPMYLEKNKSTSKKIIPIGLADNWIKISSGYCFQNAIRNSEIIVNNIIKKKNLTLKKNKISSFLDEIFCLHLELYPQKTPELFYLFFKKLSLKNIVNFLTENYSFKELIKVLIILPKRNLILSFILLIKKKIKNVY